MFNLSKPRRDTRFLNILIYGEYGNGKTHIAATSADVPQMKNVLYVDVEGGDLTLTEKWPDMPTVHIDSYNMIDKIRQFLAKHVVYRDSGDQAAINEWHKRIDPEYDPEEHGDAPIFNTVVIVSMSELHKYCMYSLLGIKVGEANLGDEPEKAGWDEWGKATEMTRLLVRTFRDMPINFVGVCSEKMAENDKKRSPIIINMPKALAAELPGFFDIVGYLTADNKVGGPQGQVVERRLYMGPGNPWVSKNRFGFDQPYLRDPDMPKLVKMINKG